MAFCTACGAALEAHSNFCAACGAQVGAAPRESAAVSTAPAAIPTASPSDPSYEGFFGHRRRNRDFRAHIEAALSDDILSADEEASLRSWTDTQGVTESDWSSHF